MCILVAQNCVYVGNNVLLFLQMSELRSKYTVCEAKRVQGYEVLGEILEVPGPAPTQNLKKRWRCTDAQTRPLKDYFIAEIENI